MQSLSTGDESTTDIIKGFLCEFDHKQGEVEDNHPGRGNNKKAH